MEEEKGRNQCEVCLGADSSLPLGHFSVCVVKRNERVTLNNEEGKQRRDLVPIRAIISTFMMNSQTQEMGK